MPAFVPNDFYHTCKSIPVTLDKPLTDISFALNSSRRITQSVIAPCKGCTVVRAAGWLACFTVQSFLAMVSHFTCLEVFLFIFLSCGQCSDLPHTSSWGCNEAHAWALGCVEQIRDKGANVLISAGSSSCILGKCRWPSVQCTMFFFSFPLVLLYV